jgi:hypothetical protein
MWRRRKTSQVFLARGGCFLFGQWESRAAVQRAEKKASNMKPRGMQIELTRARTFSLRRPPSLQRMQTNWTCLMQEIHYGVVPMHTGREDADAAKLTANTAAWLLCRAAVFAISPDLRGATNSRETITILFVVSKPPALFFFW